MLSLLHLVVKGQQYFATSNCMSLDEKIVLEIWLNLGLNLTIFSRNRAQSDKLNLLEAVRRVPRSADFCTWTYFSTDP